MAKTVIFLLLLSGLQNSASQDLQSTTDDPNIDSSTPSADDDGLPPTVCDENATGPLDGSCSAVRRVPSILT